jgi:hypothetical protein
LYRFFVVRLASQVSKLHADLPKRELEPSLAHRLDNLQTHQAHVMQLSDLVTKLQDRNPEATDVYIARLALLVTKLVEDWPVMVQDGKLADVCATIELKMSALHDQQAAIAHELDELATSAPCEFNPKHVWTLVRGIKVQTQLLNQYLD